MLLLLLAHGPAKHSGHIVLGEYRRELLQARHAVEHGLHLRRQDEGRVMQVRVVVFGRDLLALPCSPVGALEEWVDRVGSEHEGVVARRVGWLVALEDERIAEHARHHLRRRRDADLGPLRRIKVEDQDTARREESLAVLVKRGREEWLGLVEIRRVDQDGVEGTIIHARDWVACLLATTRIDRGTQRGAIEHRK
jgi:hypothetical protein